MTQIMGDPAIAHQPDHPLIAQYMRLFEPDYDTAEERQRLLDGWVALAEDGTSWEPFGDDRPMIATRLNGDLDGVSADEVRFRFCVEWSYVVRNAAGRAEQEVPLRLQPGEGAAVRVDGEWRLGPVQLLPEDRCA